MKLDKPRNCLKLVNIMGNIIRATLFVAFAIGLMNTLSVQEQTAAMPTYGSLMMVAAH